MNRDAVLQCFAQEIEALTGEQRKFFEQNILLAKSLISQYYIPNQSYDEKLSIAYDVLLWTARKYDPASGFKFSTYYAKALENRVKDLYYQRQKEPPTVSLQTPIGEDDDIRTLEEYISDVKQLRLEDELSYNLLKQKIYEALPLREFRVVQMIEEGYTYQEIAEQLGLKTAGAITFIVKGKILPAIEKLVKEWTKEAMRYYRGRDAGNITACSRLEHIVNSSLFLRVLTKEGRYVPSF